MFFCGSNAGMETSAPLINVIVNNALFHSNWYGILGLNVPLDTIGPIGHFRDGGPEQ